MWEELFVILIWKIKPVSPPLFIILLEKHYFSIAHITAFIIMLL